MVNSKQLEELFKVIFQSAIWKEDLEAFLTEIKRVDLDAKRIRETFHAYASFDSILSEVENHSRESVQDWGTYIVQTLGELQKRRNLEANEVGKIGSMYAFDDQAVHLAYLGAVEEVILLLPRPQADS